MKTKFAQYHAFEDKETRLEIAKRFIEAKLKGLKLFLIS
ncbi:CRISPR-associated endonuclease Cas1 [Methanosarcina mazei]|nr:CRISPR-associated endonuclease Cas1 [Methanosarcina mazei]